MEILNWSAVDRRFKSTDLNQSLRIILLFASWRGLEDVRILWLENCGGTIRLVEDVLFEE